MPDFASDFFAHDQALRAQVEYVDLSIVLWKDGELEPSATTTWAEILAAQCDFSGYALITLLALEGPFRFEDGGWYLDTGLLVWEVVTATPLVTNVVGGYAIADADSNVLQVGTLDSPVPMAVVGDPLELVIRQAYGVPVITTV